MTPQGFCDRTIGGRPAGVVRDVACAGMLTRYTVVLDRGRELQVVRQKASDIADTDREGT